MDLSADLHHGEMVDLVDQRQPGHLSQPLAQRLLLVTPVAVVQHDGCARAQLVAEGWHGGLARELFVCPAAVDQEKIERRIRSFSTVPPQCARSDARLSGAIRVAQIMPPRTTSPRRRACHRWVRTASLSSGCARCPRILAGVWGHLRRWVLISHYRGAPPTAAARSAALSSPGRLPARAARRPSSASRVLMGAERP